MAEKYYWQGIMFWGLTIILAGGLLIFWLILEVTAAPRPNWRAIGTWEITSYNCVVAQCDAEPDIGAYGRVARKGVPTGRWFAGNRFKKGDRIVIPALTGGIIWECRDRTAAKVSHRIDLLYPLGETVGGVRHAQVYAVMK